MRVNKKAKQLSLTLTKVLNEVDHVVKLTNSFYALIITLIEMLDTIIDRIYLISIRPTMIYTILLIELTSRTQ